MTPLLVRPPIAELALVTSCSKEYVGFQNQMTPLRIQIRLCCRFTAPAVRVASNSKEYGGFQNQMIPLLIQSFFRPPSPRN